VEAIEGLASDGHQWKAATNARPLLTAHENSSPLPCHCGKCLGHAPEKATVEELEFSRGSVEAKGRVLHFWVPAEVAGELHEIGLSMKGRFWPG